MTEIIAGFINGFLALRKRILAIVFTFLLSIFPNSSYVLGCYQTYTYPGKHVITEQVMDAIINEDIDALIGMLSEESRNNIEPIAIIIYAFWKWVTKTAITEITEVIARKAT